MLEQLYQIGESLQRALLDQLPQAIMSVLILALGLGLAWLAKLLVKKFLRRVSRFLDTRLKDFYLSQFIDIVSKLVYWFIILLTLLAISDILNFGLATVGLAIVFQYLPNLLGACLIVIGAFILGKFVAKFIETISSNAGVSYGHTLGRIVQYGIIFIAVIIAVDQIGLQVDFFIDIIDIILAALLFGAALSFALGARTSISNILATLYVRKTYKQGDKIRIGDVTGEIIAIEATAVVLEIEGGQCSIPAKEFSETRSFLIKSN